MAAAGMAWDMSEGAGRTENPAAAALRDLVVAGEGLRRRHAKQLGLGTADLIVLGHVFTHGPAAPHELGALVGMRSGAMTSLLDRVERAGLVARASNPQDRRGLLITATPAGRKAMEPIYRLFDQAIDNALASTPEIDRDRLAATLQSLTEGLLQPLPHDT
ncbi:MarR family winged helix-turn-helix transcriptional regulator [Sinomonas terrae]|uniref:MarR family transcriptional regulator n=1 Tax=Sinomonas terrae TaxID=2908838 RepID=A0ABS9U5X5_9MICC|nr:MarR family transcriptional regulator [Sinomonas terrae]MCH6472088.1 MarR family transcriptional regulator [Sinomonas terrae]